MREIPKSNKTSSLVFINVFLNQLFTALKFRLEDQSVCEQGFASIATVFNRIAFFLETEKNIAAGLQDECEKIFKDIFCSIYQDSSMASFSRPFTEVFIAYKDIPYDERKSLIKVLIKSAEVQNFQMEEFDQYFEKFKASKWMQQYHVSPTNTLTEELRELVINVLSKIQQRPTEENHK